MITRLGCCLFFLYFLYFFLFIFLIFTFLLFCFLPSVSSIDTLLQKNICEKQSNLQSLWQIVCALCNRKNKNKYRFTVIFTRAFICVTIFYLHPFLPIANTYPTMHGLRVAVTKAMALTTPTWNWTTEPTCPCLERSICNKCR